MKDTLFITIIIVVGGFLLFGSDISMYKKDIQVDRVLAEEYSIYGYEGLSHQKPDNWDPAEGTIVGKLKVGHQKQAIQIIEGVDTEHSNALGRMIEFSSPGEKGPTVLYDISNAWTENISEILVGDDIYISYSYGSYFYEIEKTQTVNGQTLLQIEEDVEKLIIISCTKPDLSDQVQDEKCHYIYALPVDI